MAERKDFSEVNKHISDIMDVLSTLEKQIPKKPTLDTAFPSGTLWWICPACNQDDIETNDRYCHECGQALDWSDTE